MFCPHIKVLIAAIHVKVVLMGTLNCIIFSFPFKKNTFVY